MSKNLDDSELRDAIETLLLVGFLTGVSVRLMFHLAAFSVMAVVCGLTLAWMLLRDMLE